MRYNTMYFQVAYHTIGSIVRCTLGPLSAMCCCQASAPMFQPSYACIHSNSNYYSNSNNNSSTTVTAAEVTTATATATAKPARYSTCAVGKHAVVQLRSEVAPAAGTQHLDCIALHCIGATLNKTLASSVQACNAR